MNDYSIEDRYMRECSHTEVLELCGLCGKVLRTIEDYRRHIIESGSCSDTIYLDAALAAEEGK